MVSWAPEGLGDGRVRGREIVGWRKPSLFGHLDEADVLLHVAPNHQAPVYEASRAPIAAADDGGRAGQLTPLPEEVVVPVAVGAGGGAGRGLQAEPPEHAP